MVEILSQEEVDALLKTIGEEKEKINPEQESPEYLEKMEKVKTLLHDFYQERQKNLPVHREIGELADNLKNFLEKAIYFGKKYFKTTEDRVVEDIWNKERYNVGIRFITEEGEAGTEYEEVMIKDLEMVLNNADLDEKEKKELGELIKNIQKTENALDLKVDELWKIRENIARELIKDSSEYKGWKDANFSKGGFVNTPNTIYNLDNFLRAEKEIESETGAKIETLFFTEEAVSAKKLLEEMRVNYKITEQELKEIKKLEFGAEYKKSLLGLRKAMETYDIEADKIVEIFCSFEGYEILENGGENIKREFKEGKARYLYRKAKLPSVHEKRVIQQIMNGTFEFEELCK